MQIRNKIIKVESVEWRKLRWLQSNLKEMSKVQFEKLKQSLKVNGFAAPFFVWENGERWILDGHHRKKAMESLEAEGHTIPDELPANFIDCKDEKEAKKLVLVYSSIYARVSEDSLYEFLNVNDLSFDELKMEIDLPDLNLSKFERGWMSDEVEEDEIPELPIEPRTKLGDLYECGRHRLLCGDSTKPEDMKRLAENLKFDLVLTDPPYGINHDPSWLSSLNMQRGKPPNKSDAPIVGDDGMLDLSWLLDFPKRIVFGFPFLTAEDATGWLIWDKQPGLDTDATLGNPCEMAYSTVWSGFKIVRAMWSGYLRDGREPRFEHPTQKPLKVLRY